MVCESHVDKILPDHTTQASGAVSTHMSLRKRHNVHTFVVCVCVRVRARVWRVSVCETLCACVCACVCVCMFVCIHYINIYIYMYIYDYTVTVSKWSTRQVIKSFLSPLVNRLYSTSFAFITSTFKGQPHNINQQELIHSNSSQPTARFEPTHLGEILPTGLPCSTT